MKYISIPILTTTIALSATSLVSETLTPIETLGRTLFFDTDLSFNRNQSCASCHDPAAGFTSPHDQFNAAGSVVEGSVPDRFGNRKPPSAAYASPAPVFHHVIEDGDFLFVGGAFLDGRATGGALGNPAADQALGPFLNPVEMAMPHAACVVQRVCRPENQTPYRVALTDVWGLEICKIAFPEDLQKQCETLDADISLPDDIAEKVETAFNRIGLTISAYESSAEVNRYSSRYDKYLAGTADLSPQEMAGLQLFEGKALCSACHTTGPGPNAEPAVFTDFTYDNLGVPRNGDNPVYTLTPDFVDTGLGAFLATDVVFDVIATTQNGKFKVPTLRNVDMRILPNSEHAYMHNGYFKTLEGVVRFYNTRDVWPRCEQKFVSEADALAQKCWPAAEYEPTVNRDELGNLKLTDADEAALVAFLKALTDE